MTDDTVAGPRLAYRSAMRARWIVVIAAGWLVQQAVFPGTEGDAATPPVALGAKAAADGPSPQGLARLVAMTRGWWEQMEERHEPNDALVFCVRGEDSEFLRQSECTRRGGRAEEPDWARD